MNTNKNAQNVIKIPADEKSFAVISSASGPFPRLSFSGGDAFTISFSAFYKKNNSGVIIEQEGSFSITIADSKLVYEAEGLGAVNAVLDTSITLENEFNNFDITYDAKILKIYINAVLLNEKQVAAPAVYSEKPIKLGRGYEGYLNKFVIANTALTHEQIARDARSSWLPLKNLVACIDFSGFNPVDCGKHKLRITFEGFCAPKNIVKALTMTKDGIAAI